MSYHNDPYRVDYLKIYPCLKERPDVLEVLKKSDRKMKYMEVDLKSEQRRKNAANGAESYIPSKEDYHDNRAIDEKHILLWEQIVQVI